MMEQCLPIFQETDQISSPWSSVQRLVTIGNAEGPRL